MPLPSPQNSKSPKPQRPCPQHHNHHVSSPTNEGTNSTAQHHNWTVPLVNQTTQFLTYANPILTLTQPPIINIHKTLVVFWIGINDIGDTSTWTNITSFPTFYNELINTQFSAVEEIYDAGYRNFLFMNLPPLDKTPGNVVREEEGKGALPNATMVESWNEVLAEHVEALTARHNNHTSPATSTSTTSQKQEGEVSIILIDTNTFLNQILTSPSSYGIKNTTSYCPTYDQLGINTDPSAFGCLPLSEYFWFNTGHLTSHVHELLAGEVERVLLS